MTDSLFARASAAAGEWVIEPCRDVRLLASLLEQDRLGGAYALAQLEPEGFPQTEWWISHTAQGAALLCHSRGGLGDATYMQGPPDAVAAILALHAPAGPTFLTARPVHRPGLERTFRFNGARVMRRMHVTRSGFRSADGAAVPLSGRQVRAINRLYSSEGVATAYAARHIDEGCYFGVIEDGRLVAIAGTHAISRRYGLAVVGNVFTHPAARGRGCATLATSAVTAALLERCPDVVLSVEPGNTPAVRAYQTLGYQDGGDIIEASAQRRASGTGMALRRWRAAFRGRRTGVEVIRRTEAER